MRCHYCYDLWSYCYKIFICKSILCCSFVGSSVRNVPFEQIRTAVFKKIRNWGKFSSLNFDVCSLSATNCSWKVDAVCRWCFRRASRCSVQCRVLIKLREPLNDRKRFLAILKLRCFVKFCPDILCKLWEKSVLCGYFIEMLHYVADMEE